RHEHLAWSGQRSHAGADDHGDAAELLSDDLALARVQAGPDLEAEVAHRALDRGRAADRADRAVEGREEAVPGRVELAALKAVELRADDPMVTLDEVRPGPVAQLDSPDRRVDDVREQDRREHGVWHRLAGHAVEEPDDLVDEPVSEPVHHVRSA